MLHNLPSPSNMARRTSTLIASLAGSFVGVHLATGLCRLFLLVGQNIDYLYHFILCSSVTASLALAILYYATKPQAVLDSSLPSPTQPPVVPGSNNFDERYQPQQPNPDSLTSHQKQLLELFATTAVNESPPSDDGHTNPDRTLEDIRRVIEETSALVVDEQPPVSLSNMEHPPPDPQIATNKRKKNKKPKVRCPSSAMSKY